MDIESRIVALLSSVGAPVQILDHPPGGSALGVAAARGTSASIGGKAILMKLDCLEGDPFAILAIPGDGKLDGASIRRGLGARRYRFATPEELLAYTSLSPGELPPFGRPLFDLPLLVDEGLARNAEIAFTVGRKDRSILTETAGWLRAAEPLRVLPLTAR